ncbi:MAG: DUF3124 domain-containing protein [Hyphomicrobiales bacterium]
MLNLFRLRPRIRATGALILCGLFAWSAADSVSAEDGRSSGQSVYVPVYSHILFGDRAARFNLAATLIIRNIDPLQTITVRAADYHDSGGRLLKKHLEQPVLLKPLASTEVFVPESDTSGGLGASFIVRWTSEKLAVPPVIECIMIGTRSGQGISIVSQGRVISENSN